MYVNYSVYIYTYMYAVILRLLCSPLTVSKEALQALVVALVSRLKYGSATLASFLKQLLDRLQSVQNTAVHS